MNINQQVTDLINIVPIVSIVSKTYSDSPYTAVIKNLIKYDCTSGNSIINLPTAVGNSNLTIVIKKIDISSNILTVNPNGTETIDGQTNYALGVQWETVTFISDNTNWLVL